MSTVWITIALVWVIAWWSMRRVQKVEGAIPLENLAVVFLLVLSIYGTLPPLWWIVQGGEYQTPFSGRLFYLQPSAEEQARLATLVLLIAVGVAAAQLLFPRRYVRPANGMVRHVPVRVVVVCLMFVVMEFAVVSALNLGGVIRSSSSYIDQYRALQELPLALRQLLKLLAGLSLLSKITILVWLFQNWRRQRMWVFAFIIFTLLAVDPSGSRAPAVIALLACTILWNRYVRPLSYTDLAVLGTVGIAVFTALGIYRSLNTVSLGVGIFEAGLGEFEVLWANAVELQREKMAGRLRVPSSLHYSEYYGPIPAVLLPFEKLTYSGWYLDAYYPQYQRMGGGLMFGFVSQVVIGLGWAEALARGFGVGIFLRGLTAYLGRGTRWWHYPVLVYCSVLTFQVVRDSSLALLTPLIQTVAVGVFALTALAAVIPVRRRISLRT